MFSKALFKQSIKANGIMWIIITFAVCFMLSCVMLISGTSTISEVKTSVSDTIIKEEIDSTIKKNEIAMYNMAYVGETKFDEYFVIEYQNTLTKEMEDPSFLQKVGQKVIGGMSQADAVKATIAELSTKIATDAYINAINDVTNYVSDASLTQAKKTNNNDSLTKDSDEYKEIYNQFFGSVMATINPNHKADNTYTDNNEVVPADYELEELAKLAISDKLLDEDKATEYINSSERVNYRSNRAIYSTNILVAANTTSPEALTKLLEILSNYGVTLDKYLSYGYNYDNIKRMCEKSIKIYITEYNDELAHLDPTLTPEEKQNKIDEINDKIILEIAGTLLNKLPNEVSDAIEEIGRMDLYALIVGSIFFKIAGLLLPIIYMIMVSNSLIVGQVDSGSMAYVLSTSTKRRSVTFTQSIFMVSSLLLMFIATTITSFICFAIVDVETDLTYGKLALINLGAFLVLFAMSGINFFTSCIFDRSKRSMAIGGGLSIFFLVATMLGLFGSKVIPSVVRIKALDNFNYVSIISLFNVVKILDGKASFIPGLIILLVIGLIGYIAGSIIFKKKDLPL
ncbi:MAG: ABC transporter permease [bacterium]|nr:ABC transporter permease [bacterium]